MEKLLRIHPDALYDADYLDCVIETDDYKTPELALKYIEEGQFAPGSMLPKVQAAMKFVRAYPNKKAIITSLDKAIDALNGETGTVITFA